MPFEWDEDKAELNLMKHNVSFERAACVFDDPLVMFFEDPYEWEKRFRAIGNVDGDVYFVVFSKSGDRTRIISARKASRDEYRTYRLF